MKSEKGKKWKIGKIADFRSEHQSLPNFFPDLPPNIFFLVPLPSGHIWVNWTCPSAVVYHALRNFLWKEPMLRWLSGFFPCVSGLIPLQGKSVYGWILVPGGRIGFFHLQEVWRTSWPQGHPDREKNFNLSPRDLGPSPLNAGQVWHLDLCVTLGV